MNRANPDADDSLTVLAAARLAAHPIVDAELAGRIAEGAANAIAAVRAFAHESLAAHEPADFAALLEALAPRGAGTPKSEDAGASPPASRARPDPATDPLEADLVEIAARLARREISSVELTRAALERAEREQRRLNCFIELRPDAALAAAAAADAALASGAAPGVLHGVPLAHKDVFDVVGHAPSCGSRLRLPVAGRSATLIGRLEAAGALSLGYLNMAEFALGPVGDNAHWGRCRNAVDPHSIAGGSSSGSGSAVAARAIYGSIGSDTGGSIRIPAAANGIVGVKPTWSRVPRDGGMRLSPSLDVFGPLARSVRDAARLLRVIAGGDPRDPTSSPRGVDDYEAAAARGHEQALAGLRIGVPRNYFREQLSPDVLAACDASLRALEERGARLVEVQIPHAAAYAELSRAVLYPEVTALHGQRLREHAGRYSPQVRVRASTGLAIPASTHCEALMLRAPLLQRFAEAVFAHCEVLHTPTLAVPVPRYADLEAGTGPTLWAMLAGLVRCTAPFNYLGLPAVTVPAGVTRNGLPAGVQLVGRPFDEALLFRVAAAHEAAFAPAS